MIMYEPYADDGNEDTSYANKQNDVVPYAHVCPGSPNPDLGFNQLCNSLIYGAGDCDADDENEDYDDDDDCAC